MNVNFPELETERLLLRKFTEADMEAVFAIYSDQEVNTYLPWFPIESYADAQWFFAEQYAELYKLTSDYKYAVCMKSDNIPVGYVNVSMADHHDLGYGLRKEFWHRGIMTEAGKAVVNQVKADGLPYITATHDVKNPRSGAVMKRLGMVYQYSYEELWQPKNFLVTFRMYQLNLNGSTDRVYRKYWNDAKVHFVEVEPQE